MNPQAQPVFTTTHARHDSINSINWKPHLKNDRASTTCIEKSLGTGGSLLLAWVGSHTQPWSMLLLIGLHKPSHNNSC
jgi:hypothetical protein